MRLMMDEIARECDRTAAWKQCKDLGAWQWSVIGIFVLAVAVNMLQWAWIVSLEASRREDAAKYRVQLESMERMRDLAVEQLGAAVLQAEADKQARAEQAAAYEMAGMYQYIGECTITAYCPCAECCGRWADGVTATGLPAGPGVVAVDPEVIPLGSAVIIDGQRYLAADTGVMGNHVDICLADHGDTAAFGVKTAEVWVEVMEK